MCQQSVLHSGWVLHGQPAGNCWAKREPWQTFSSRFWTSVHRCASTCKHTPPIIKLLCQPRIKWGQPHRHSFKYHKGKSGINMSVFSEVNIMSFYSEVNLTATCHCNFSIFPPLCSSGNRGLLSKAFSQSFSQSWRRSLSWQAHDPCRRPLTHTDGFYLSKSALWSSRNYCF